MEESDEIEERRELRSSLQRLSRILVDRLEQGSRDGSLDQGQMRILGSLALRSLRLWKQSLGNRRLSKDGTPSKAEAELAEGLARLNRGVQS